MPVNVVKSSNNGSSYLYTSIKGDGCFVTGCWWGFAGVDGQTRDFYFYNRCVYATTASNLPVYETSLSNSRQHKSLATVTPGAGSGTF